MVGQQDEIATTVLMLVVTVQCQYYQCHHQKVRGVLIAMVYVVGLPTLIPAQENVLVSLNSKYEIM